MDATEKTQIVISLNMFGPEEVCPPGTSFQAALQRCDQLREAYLIKHPEMDRNDIRFHARNVPVVACY